MMCLETAKAVNHQAQIPGFRHLRTTAFSLPHSRWRETPRFNPAEAGWHTRALWALCSGKWDQLYREDAVYVSEPNRQGVNPAVTIHSPCAWLFWKIFPEICRRKKNNLMISSKAKGLFLFCIGWEASSLSLLSFFFFFKNIKQRKRGENKGGKVWTHVLRYFKICSCYHF